jgi:uncharacterized protein (DUF1697 family)
MKTSKNYLALLRGINVGGNNIIKMSDLKACFEDCGFTNVTTYIQSGNVIFTSEKGNAESLETLIEDALSKQFKYKSRVVVVAQNVLAEIIKQAPKNFGLKPEEYRYDVIFLKRPLSPSQALAVTETKEGVDTASAGKNAVYFSRLISQATKSKLSKIIQKPEYQFMTIRNWNTTTKLAKLIE